MTGDRSDPVLGYNFSISLTDSASPLSVVFKVVGQAAVGGFSECSGLDASMEIEEYKEGGNNGLIRKFPSHMKWANLRLRRGIVVNDELWKWYFDYVQGQGKRRDGIVTLMDDQQNPMRAWRFKRGLPVHWVGPSMNAAQSQVAIEELEIGHEGIKEMSSGAAGFFGGF
jgi:phage tail-like protein